MNVLFLSTRSPYPLISGHSLRTYHILKGVAERHNVSLVTFIQLEEELNKENLEHLRSFCQDVYTYRIPVDMSRLKLTTSLFLNLISPLPFVAQKYDLSMIRCKIREIIQSKGIDIVHVDMLPLSIYINEFEQLPKVLVNHNVESVRLNRWYQTESNILKKAYLGVQLLKLKAFERSSINKYDCCVVVSEIDKNYLQRMGVKKKLFVVPNGTDTTYFKLTGREIIKNSVMWIGHMDVHTNKDAVLYFWHEIYPLLLKKHPNVQITFLGTSPPKEIVKATKTDSQIKVTGFVTDIRNYAIEAAVIVVPIRIGSGTRIKILDAMAMGKAIVSTSIACEGLNVTNGKNILIADNPEDFAESVITLLEDKEIRMNLEKESRKLAETYDWQTIKDKQEIVYQKIMKGIES